MGHDGFTAPRRVGFIDELRGLDIIVMVLYHAMYDIVYIFGVDIPFFYNFLMPYVQPFIAGIFIVLSGISCRYSKSNLKRGLKTLMLGMALTVVTLIFMPSEAIYFGILHFMGTAMILFAVLKPMLDRTPVGMGLIVSIVLYILTRHLPQGWIGIESLFKVSLPTQLYTKSYLLPLGFAGAGSDYFPLLPYFFMYTAGSFIGVFFKRDQMPHWLYNTRIRLFSVIGRHTLLIYMLHQPVILIVISAYFWLTGTIVNAL